MEIWGCIVVDCFEWEIGGVKVIVWKFYFFIRKGVIGIKDGFVRREVFGSNYILVKLF